MFKILSFIGSGRSISGFHFLYLAECIHDIAALSLHTADLCNDLIVLQLTLPRTERLEVLLIFLERGLRFADVLSNFLDFLVQSNSSFIKVQAAFQSTGSAPANSLFQ